MRPRRLWLIGALSIGAAVAACNDVVSAFPALPGGERGGIGVVGGTQPGSIGAAPDAPVAPPPVDGGVEHFDGGTGLFDAAGPAGLAAATDVYDSVDEPAR